MPALDKEAIREFAKKGHASDKFIRGGELVAFGGSNHSHIADEMKIQRIDDAGYFQYGQFKFGEKAGIRLRGRSDYLDIGGESTEQRKTTIEILRRQLKGMVDDIE